MENAGFPNYLSLFSGNSWLEKMDKGLYSLNNKEIASLFSLWHAIWSLRNDIWQGKKVDPAAIIRDKALNMVEVFGNAELDDLTPPNYRQSPSRWLPPP